MIIKVAPGVIKDLHANTANLYSMAYKHFELKDNLLKWEYIKHAKQEYLPELVPLKQELRTWSSRYNLSFKWILEEAISTLHEWHVSPEIEGIDWAYKPTTKLSAPYPVKGFSYLAWNPATLSKGTYIRQVRNALNSYLDRVDKMIAAHNWTKKRCSILNGLFYIKLMVGHIVKLPISTIKIRIQFVKAFRERPSYQALRYAREAEAPNTED